MLAFCRWLEATPWSIALHESLWAYAIIESAHVLSLCVFVGIAVLWDFRLLRLTLRDVPVSEFLARLMPWMVAGFVVMVVTGALLFFGIPVRSYQSVFFRAKVVMLILAGVNAWVFHATVGRRVVEWDSAPILPRAARVAGVVSLCLWAAVIFSGRMIAYNWFDCDTPQSDLVRTLAGCTDDLRE
ncbi:MAG: DUF6644 family protein [Vicinamibacterales bacterium]